MFLFRRKCYTLILIISTVFPQAITCQSVQDTINQLPKCSTKCTPSAATTASCASLSLMEVTGRYDCLLKDCAIVEALSTQLLLDKICGLLRGTTTSPVLPASAQSTAAPSTHTSSPTLVIEPSSRPKGNFTARKSPTHVPVTTLIAIPPEKITRTSTIQSTPIPAVTLPYTESVTSSTHGALTTSPSVILSSALFPTSQTSITSPLSSLSISPSPTTLNPATSTAQADISSSKPQPSQVSATASVILPAASTPTAKSWQAEANQETTSRTAEKATSNNPSPVVIAAVIFGVLVLAALFTLNLFLIRRRKQALRKKQQRAMSTISVMTGMSGEDITVFLDLEDQGMGDDGKKNGGWSTRKSENVRGKRVWRGHKPRVPVGEKEQELKFSFDFRNGLNSHPPKL